jgi:putative PIN family toxin of toxin-antitoxin system
MRTVLDINVLVSANIQPLGKAGQIVSRATRFEFEWLTCEHILIKMAEVVARPHIRKKYQKRFAPARLAEFFALVREVAEMVEVKSQLKVVGDPEDDIILACAKDGQADYLVSGDPHLITMGHYEQIKIVTPAKFLNALQVEESKS